MKRKSRHHSLFLYSLPRLDGDESVTGLIPEIKGTGCNSLPRLDGDERTAHGRLTGTGLQQPSPLGWGHLEIGHFYIDKNKIKKETKNVFIKSS